jgi:hypothetical protein
MPTSGAEPIVIWVAVSELVVIVLAVIELVVAAFRNMFEAIRADVMQSRNKRHQCCKLKPMYF